MTKQEKEILFKDVADAYNNLEEVVKNGNSHGRKTGRLVIVHKMYDLLDDLMLVDEYIAWCKKCGQEYLIRHIWDLEDQVAFASYRNKEE